MNTESSTKSISALIDTALVLAFITGLFYALGYSYIEGYYKYFNIPISLIEPDYQVILLFGSNYLWVISLLTAFLLIFLLIISTGCECLFKRELTIISSIKSNKHTLYLAVALFLIAISLYAVITIGYFYSKGYDAANKYAHNSAPLVEITYTNSDGTIGLNKLGLISGKNSDFYLFELPIVNSKPTVILKQKEIITQIKIIGTVSDYIPPKKP